MYLTRKRRQQLRWYKYIASTGAFCLIAGLSLSSESPKNSDDVTKLEISSRNSKSELLNGSEIGVDKTSDFVTDGSESKGNIELAGMGKLQEQIELNRKMLDRTSLPEIPTKIPEPSLDGFIYLTMKDGSKRRTTLDAQYQASLTKYVQQKGNHIAGMVVANAKTGQILAMIQGKESKAWGEKGHTALYPGFPAASIFKNVTTASALDVLSFDEDKQVGLRGGCANVHSRGVWLKDVAPSRHYRMTLRTAYGRSCNGFFAKMAVSEVGLGTIKKYAGRFGWGRTIPTDFQLQASPIIAPNPAESSIHTVGRFAAGFGLVGLSAAHGAWFMVAIANDGVPKPLMIFSDTPQAPVSTTERLFSAETGQRLRSIMKKTTNGGTAGSIYRKRRYRRLRPLVGGKTGSLNGKTPKGLTNWFTGIMPVDNPEIVVAAVTVTNDFWIIKGPHLAAEGFRQWYDLKKNRISISRSSKKTPRISKAVH